MHCGPLGEEGQGNKDIPNIVVGVIHEGFEEREEGTVNAFSLAVALGVVGSCVGLLILVVIFSLYKYISPFSYENDHA